MSDSNLKEELELLRAQVENLSSRVEGQKEVREEADIASNLEKVRRVADSLELPQLSEQLEALLKKLSADMKDSKPGALAASFAVGVLVGKILSR